MMIVFSQANRAIHSSPKVNHQLQYSL